MSKTVQAYDSDLGLAQAQKLQGNQGRVKRGVSPNFVMPAGTIIFGDTSTPPSGYTWTGWQILTYNNDGTVAASNLYAHIKS